MRAFGEEEPSALEENARYRTGFLAFQRWSPLVVPLALGGVLLALALVATAHNQEQPFTLASEGGPGTLVALALVAGGLLGTLLYIMPNSALWLGVLLAGSTLYAAGMLCAVFGFLAGIVPIAVLAAAGWQYVRKHRLEVPEGTVTLTAHKGSYLRTLYPGNNLLWPGEQEMGALETGQRIYISPAQQTQVRASTGARYRASASAIVSFAVIPSEAHAIARSFDSWEVDLQQLIAVALREALQQWGAQEMARTDGMQPGLVARWVLDEVRGWARASGIWVAWVRVCHLQLSPAWDEVESAAPAQRRGTANARVAHRQRSGTGYAARVTQVPTEVGFAARVSQTPSAPRLPAMEDAAARLMAGAFDQTSALPQASERRNEDLDQLTPEALGDIYEAIRDGHINDPATIRDVAQAFARLAQETPIEHELPFDAAAAADALLRFAAQIERHRASRERQA